MATIPKNTEFPLYFPSATTAGAPNTTTTPVVKISKNRGILTAATNAATHLGDGLWVVLLTAAEMNANSIGWTATGTGIAAGVGGTIVPEPGNYTAARAVKLDNLDASVQETLLTADGAYVMAENVQIILNQRLSALRAAKIENLNYSVLDTFNAALQASEGHGQTQTLIAEASPVVWQGSENTTILSQFQMNVEPRAGMLVRVTLEGIPHYRKIASYNQGFGGAYYAVLDIAVMAGFGPVFGGGPTMYITVFREAAPIADYQQRLVAVTLPPAPEGYGGGSGGGLDSGPVPVRLEFRDAASVPVPGLVFYIDGLGEGYSQANGNATLSLPIGSYNLRVAPGGGVIFPAQSITITAVDAGVPLAEQTQVILVGAYGFITPPSQPEAFAAWAITARAILPISAQSTGTANLTFTVEARDVNGVLQDASILTAQAAIDIGTPPDADAPTDPALWKAVCITRIDGAPGLIAAPPRYVATVPVGVGTDFPLTEGLEVTLFLRISQGTNPSARQTTFPIIFTPS